jgi:hypothetical protein
MLNVKLSVCLVNALALELNVWQNVQEARI